MNRKQKIVLWIGIGIFALMALFLPLVISIQGVIEQQGYGFILIPPEKYCHINTSRLYVQWIMVAVVTGGFIVTFKDKKN